MVVALAFVPLQHLETAFQELVQHLIGTAPELQEFLIWFENYYMGAMQLGRRLQARFPRELWSCHQRVINNRDRTNNYAGSKIFENIYI